MSHIPVGAEGCAVAAIGSSGATFGGKGTHLAEEVGKEGFHGWEASSDYAYVHLNSVRMSVRVGVYVGKEKCSLLPDVVPRSVAGPVCNLEEVVLHRGFVDGYGRGEETQA
jgi:hypothetical protein